ncbi:uracil-DNA glycosylase [Pseudomonadales bacterium]|nr:uracil-DNA glycosylase [Pseudomonadales bacterium]
MNKIQLHGSWRKKLDGEFDCDYMLALQAFLTEQKAQGKLMYPPEQQVFNALNSTAFEAVKVIIIGQDPYHGEGQAHGLCFSVPQGVPIPPSLGNIFKELKNDVGYSAPEHGCLQAWAEQGVLLLNSILTVEREQAASHAGRGWEHFTDQIIERLSTEREGLVFVLWGGYAQKKGKCIDEEKHLVLKSVHPSPLSAYRGFFGSKPFSTINSYLKAKGRATIDWQI